MPRLVLEIRHSRTHGKDGATRVPEDSLGIGTKQKALQTLFTVSSQHDQVNFMLLDGRKEARRKEAR